MFWKLSFINTPSPLFALRFFVDVSLPLMYCVQSRHVTLLLSVMLFVTSYMMTSKNSIFNITLDRNAQLRKKLKTSHRRNEHCHNIT